MYCSNCKKEVVEGSEFCPYCGSKLSSDSETLGPKNYKVYDIGQTKIKPKKRIGKGLIIVIICCIALIASAIYFTIIVDNESSRKSSSTNESIVQENIENEIKEAVEIPEDKRATVTFIEETGNVIEDREIFDRTGLCEYLDKNNNKVRNDIANMNISNAIQGGYIYNLLNSTGALYYVEYTTKIGDLPETTSSDYGSIIFWDCAGTRGSRTEFNILATIWNPLSNASNDYFLAREISNQTRGDFNQKVNNMAISTIKDFYAEGRDYMEVRVGLIETKNNPWLYEYINQQEGTDNQEETENTTEVVDTEELGDIKLTTTTDNSIKKNTLMEYLQDDEWVQDNLILKENVFGDVIVSNDQQAVKYNVINDNMIITYTNYQGSGDGMRCSILTFKDGKVYITRFEEATNRYTSYTINKDNNILYTYYTFMGQTIYRIFTIKENGVEIVGSLEMDDYVDHESENRILKYRFNGEEVDKEKYEKLKSQYIVENNNNENKFETLFRGDNYIEE